MSPRNEGLIPAFSSLNEILEHAIEHEQESHDYYLEAAERAADPDIKHQLLLLAEEEIAHKADLKKMLNKVRSDAAIQDDLMYAFGGDPLRTT
ncbi:MAG: hypothetical protein KAU50_01690 [Candidatus Marinimicrobia bacterium]|nr:hypothetical protein [Candidatus Neomarinimicrobiota bacterium]